eukprot:76947_1
MDIFADCTTSYLPSRVKLHTFCGENYDVNCAANRVMNCNNKPRNDYNHTWFAVGVLLFGDEWYSFMFILMDEMAISLLVIFGAVKDESAAEATQESVVGDTDTDATTQTETETGNQDGILSINVFDYLIQFDAQTLQRFGRVKDEFAAGLRNDTKGEHWAQDILMSKVGGRDREAALLDVREEYELFVLVDLSPAIMTQHAGKLKTRGRIYCLRSEDWIIRIVSIESNRLPVHGSNIWLEFVIA